MYRQKDTVVSIRAALDRGGGGAAANGNAPPATQLSPADAEAARAKLPLGPAASAYDLESARRAPAPAPPLQAVAGPGGGGGGDDGLQKRSGRFHGDHEEPMTSYPVPRFPPGHTSAAFDAVVVRKSLILSPAETYAECAHHGEEKAKHGWLKMLMLCFIAGCYVSIGFSLCLLVGGNLGLDIYKERPGLFSLVFGAVGFPTGFTFIVVCGGELFTSLCAYMAAAWWEGRVSARTCLRVWVVSWLGNFLGTATCLGLLLAARSYENKDAFTLLLAQKKTHHGFGSCFVLGLFCNWLVCIATWMSCAAQDLVGKVVAIWLPISAFVMMGFEHCIANQFLLPMAVALGAPLSARDVILGNLIPTTLGNWVGGAVFVGTVYAFAYGRPNALIVAWWSERCTARRGAGAAGLAGGLAGRV